MFWDDMVEDDKSQTKKRLRRCISEQLRLLNSDERAWRSEKICDLLYQSLALKSGQNIAIFGGIPSEPDLTKLMNQLWKDRVNVSFLRLNREDSSMEAFTVTSTHDFQIGAFKVIEPIPLPDRKVEIADLDVILVPGVAFHPENGARLGRGGGYYDRYLSQAPSRLLKIGVCYEVQLSSEVISEPHDIPVNFLVHDCGVRWIDPRFE